MDRFGSGMQAAGVSDYIGWLVRRWWVVVIAVVIGAVGGLGYVQTQTKEYDSSTLVLVLAPLQDGSKVDMDTQAKVVTSVQIAVGAQKLLKTQTSPLDLLSGVTVSIPANTTFLNITYEATTPLQAKNGSQAFAEAYLDQRTQDAETSLSQQISKLQDQIKQYQDSIKTLNAQIASLSSKSVDEQNAISSRDQLTAQIQTATQKLTPLDSIVVNAGQVSSPATLPTRPSKPSTLKFLASGLAIGLLLGLAAALTLARLDTRVYRTRDVPERPEVPVLMEIRPGRQRPAIADAATPIGREFSLLRNVLRVAAGAARGGRPSATDTLLVCGAVPGVGVGWVVANLAAAFARAGERIVIVCTDPESATPSVLGVRAEYGLGEVLAGELELSDVIQPIPGLRNVSVLLPGQLDPRVELPVAAVTALLEQMQQDCDRILIAAGAPNSAVDAQALSEIAAAVLLVVETRRAHVPEIDAALDQFARVYAPLAGMLVVVDHWQSKLSKPGAKKELQRVPLVRPRPTPTVDSAVAEDDVDRELDAVATESTSTPRQVSGWQGRGADSTMILPKAVDVEDPPIGDWPKSSTSADRSVPESHGADPR
jgi:Mrp family chromosome partitioning ATPase